MTRGELAEPPAEHARTDRARRRVPRASKAGGLSPMQVRILKSAAAAFRRLGYHGATVEQIAAALHMKKGNLYYYFQNKEEILFACHQYSLDRLIGLLEQMDRSHLPPDEQLRRLIVVFVHTILDELHGMALFMDLEALSPAHLKMLIERRDRVDHAVREIIRDGVRTGMFGDVDTKLVSLAMFGAVSWIPRWFNPKGAASSEEIAERFADYLVGGLRRV